MLPIHLAESIEVGTVCISALILKQLKGVQNGAIRLNKIFKFYDYKNDCFVLKTSSYSPKKKTINILQTWMPCTCRLHSNIFLVRLLQKTVITIEIVLGGYPEIKNYI